MIQEDLGKRTNSDILKSTKKDYFAMVDDKVEERIKNFFPPRNGLDYQSFYKEAVKKLRGPLVQYTQEQFNTAQANNVFTGLKGDTKNDKKTDKDDYYTSNNWLFAEAVKSAEEFRKDLESEVTGLSEIHEEDVKDKKYELSKIKNMRLEKLLAKKQRLEELCK